MKQHGGRTSADLPEAGIKEIRAMSEQGNSSTGKNRGNPVKVLLVDDDPDIVRVVDIALRREGFEVLSANSGSEGLDLAKQELPDIIILDVEMPTGVGGPEVCRMLRRDPETAEIPIVFLTARVDLDAMEETVEEEAQGYLLKPLSIYDLLEKIDEVLGRGT